MILSHKEKEVSKLVCEQLTNKEISNKLNIPIRTVEQIKSTIMFKIDAKNMVGIAIYAIKHGIYIN